MRLKVFFGFACYYNNKLSRRVKKLQNIRFFSRGLIEAIVKGYVRRERKWKLLSSLVDLDIFESSLLHRIVQNLENHPVTIWQNDFYQNFCYFSLASQNLNFGQF